MLWSHGLSTMNDQNNSQHCVTPQVPIWTQSFSILSQRSLALACTAYTKSPEDHQVRFQTSFLGQLCGTPSTNAATHHFLSQFSSPVIALSCSPPGPSDIVCKVPQEKNFSECLIYFACFVSLRNENSLMCNSCNHLL